MMDIGPHAGPPLCGPAFDTVLYALTIWLDA